MEALDGFLGQIRQLGVLGGILTAVDVAFVSYVIYRLLLLIRGTRAVPLLNGLVLLVLATAVSRGAGLRTTYWLLDKAQWALLVGLPIVFQPELRRALAHVGRARWFAPSFSALDESMADRVLGELGRALSVLSRRRVGALVVVERDTGLNEIVETGISLDAVVSAELLVNLFVPNTPLHDGAVIVRGERIVAAACYLPLTEARDLGAEFGSRHRAALGISEHSDAVALVVSEETGAISVANEGRLIRNLDEVNLRELLESLLPVPARSGGFALWPRRRPGKAHG